MHVKLKYIHFFSVGENGKIAKLKFEKKKFFAFFFVFSVQLKVKSPLNKVVLR